MLKLSMICIFVLILGVLGYIVIFGDIKEKIFTRKLKVGDKFVSPKSKNPFILNEDVNTYTILEIKNGYVLYKDEDGNTYSDEICNFYRIYVRLLKYEKIKK